ncbi:diaminopimelate epimerase [Auraticoccus monumenti]|uniref:Diaminopimelate epimerase n=1 Tax=Auraticoccus monumenti TaxID=675864 RepID=A0A1G7CKH1_9ACTN|nr:diaminopimelate epimerase [Auraticoccus monumenti]SDE39858.1 diaminopimelate epimerase [Auraticoccus monumenti]
MRSWTFAKGHGTLNDFVLLVDRHGLLDPDEDDVRWLCDRRAGIGGDGLLRAVKAEHVPSWEGDGSLWFMDYRNADGSVAEMCGNGIRVFARHLLDSGLADGPEVQVATRSGLRTVAAQPDGRLRVSMGPVRTTPDAVQVSAPVAGERRSWPATAVDVGNPHAVVLLGAPATPDVLDALDLSAAPSWVPADHFPSGVNVEFVTVLGERHLRMRVHERGSGETLSCGTGTVAVAAAHAARVGAGSGTWRVDVRGGTVEVELADGEAWMTGPAELVAHGEVVLPDRRTAA